MVGPPEIGKEEHMLVYIGIDWSEKKHDVCYMHENGEVLRDLEIAHTMEGFYRLNQTRREFGITAKSCVVGLESAHNQLVDYLWDQGYENLYILPPKVVHSNQGRYRQSRARDDRWDARLIADILRTDRTRYHAWKPDRPLTRQIRSVVRMLGQLKKEQNRHANRLRAMLLRYYPAMVGLFSRLTLPISLDFLQAYPTPQAAKALDFDELKHFLRQHHHTRTSKWPRIYNHLQEAYPQTPHELVTIYYPQAITIVQILEIMSQQTVRWQKELTRLYQQHPDREIYASLPEAGEFLEPALLAKMGDDRKRFPTPKVLQAVAGTCPITKRSGKRKYVFYRKACDRDFRHIVQQWAKLTVKSSPWAEAYYRTALDRCGSTTSATRRLANRWLEILWRLWQDRKPYDQAYHLRQHAARLKPR